MDRSRRLAFAFVLSILTACGGLFGQASPEEVAEPGPPGGEPAAELDEPPLASINGVEGMVTTFCWKSGCSDWFGHPPRGMLPRVSAPLRISLPLPASEVRVTAVGGGRAGKEIPLEVNDLLVTDPLPKGTVSVMVGVWFEEGGDAFYYWAVDQPGRQDRGGSSPSP